ncbi:hypothetical protein FJT64_026050 [Amphibalanus amphitrite]|uniref:Uncharacterized protein n=1 Tax=Amphibalanus amphitrite TaxID=1232801 RepID=A0A6A4W319_AMPAM|nr:hypothetical protein FJT64_026050 [Amphibalanus amphitrite]
MARMLLVLGDSYAHRFRSICDAGDSITASGWRGACVGDDEFRRWAIREAVLRRPQRVFLMVGSNDLARPLQDMISGMIRSALASASSVPEAATGPAPTPASGAPEASTGPATAPDAVLRLAAAAVPTTSVPAPAARSGRLTGAMGLGDLQHPDIVSELADAALAPATIKAYRTTWAQFRHFLCRRMAGLDAARLSGHCLRIGGASHGAAVGMTELQLGQAGRWSSQALRRSYGHGLSHGYAGHRHRRSLGYASYGHGYAARSHGYGYAPRSYGYASHSYGYAPASYGYGH